MRRMRKEPLDDVVDRMENLFSEFHEMGRDLAKRPGVPVDVRDEGDRIVIEADLPGVSKEDISLKADEESVEIAAEATQEVEEENEKYFRRERSSRSFRRSIHWPARIDPETVEAEFEDGVLTVTAEKQESGGRDVEIE